MSKTLLAAGALSALIALSACGGGYGYYGASVADNDVYYDGFYGPYSEGYWGPDRAFYYRGGDGRFVRGDGTHFQHRMFNGAHAYHSRPYDRDHDGALGTRQLAGPAGGPRSPPARGPGRPRHRPCARPR